MKIIKRRIPSYFSGLLLGLGIAVIWITLRTAFAPKFLDQTITLEQVDVSPGGKIKMLYKQQNPERHLAYGFPSALYVGKEQEGGQVATQQRIEYGDLVNPFVMIGPFLEAGRYEIRMALYACKQPGDATCWKKNITVPVVVQKESKQMEPNFTVDLL